MAVVWDQSVFNRTLREYLSRTSKTLPAAINAKAYDVAIWTMFYTHKASYSKMGRELGQELKVVKARPDSGRYHKRRPSLTMRGGRMYATAAAMNKAGVWQQAPLLALIINARRGKKELPGLYGSAMKAEFRRVFGARGRSVAFIKSGWIPAREILRKLKFGKGPPTERGIGAAKQYGAPKGGAVAATVGFAPVARLWNTTADSPRVIKNNQQSKVVRFGMDGLQDGFNYVTKDMLIYLRGQLRPDAASFNRKQRV